MILQNEICRIEIQLEEIYIVDSAKHHQYDIVLNPGQYQRQDFTRTLSIVIDLFTRTLKIALIGPYICNDLDCAVLERDRLTVLQNDRVTQIRITDGSVLRSSQLDCFGNHFAIYPVKQGYVIYGEIEITMLDFALNKLWFFSGKDIFASVSGKQPFALKEDRICLYDFQDNYYEIDLDGKLIRAVGRFED